MSQSYTFVCPIELAKTIFFGILQNCSNQFLFQEMKRLKIIGLVECFSPHCNQAWSKIKAIFPKEGEKYSGQAKITNVNLLTFYYIYFFSSLLLSFLFNHFPFWERTWTKSSLNFFKCFTVNLIVINKEINSLLLWIVFPQKFICGCPNLQYLSLWPYLEIVCTNVIKSKWGN